MLLSWYLVLSFLTVGVHLLREEAIYKTCMQGLAKIRASFCNAEMYNLLTRSFNRYNEGKGGDGPGPWQEDRASAVMDKCCTQMCSQGELLEMC